jgi:hypothetical protein
MRLLFKFQGEKMFRTIIGDFQALFWRSEVGYCKSKLTVTSVTHISVPSALKGDKIG